MSAATKSPTRPVQLELPLSVSVAPGFAVRPLQGGAVMIEPRPLQMWGSIADAAKMLRRSERRTRELAEAGIIPARKLPHAKMWDVNLIELQRWIEGSAVRAGGF